MLLGSASLTAIVIGAGISGAIGYLLGNISPSTILAKKQGLDIKQEGSGNAGTTNALRVMGKKAGAITMVVDILKGVLAVAIGIGIAGIYGAMCGAFFAFIGHVWPMLYGFKGGKGVAVVFGATLALCPVGALIALAIVAIVTLASKRMSVGSIVGAVCYPIIMLWLFTPFTIPAVIIAVILIYKHKGNIIRLKNGEEPKLGFLDKGNE